MKEKDSTEVRQTLFPASLFAIYLATLLLMSGVHTGLIVLANEMEWSKLTQTIIPMAYWALVAAGLTFFTRRKVRKVYETPLHRMAEAIKRVANGDFSVYIPTVHTKERYDYLDSMILDFDKMVEELGSVETLKTDFVSNVSHEMKTPIAIIKNAAELLQKDCMDEKEKAEYLKTIMDSADRLSSLITNILKLNKLEHQQISPDIKVYELSAQLSECILAYEEVWSRKGLDIDVQIEETMYIQADAGLMELVWNNLMSNAVKFTDRGGTVTVCQNRDDRYGYISFADNGCGMSKDCVKHIFDKFYQGDTSHTREGNGLGLALVKRVLELMNGSIHVESSEGKGTMFTVILPLAPKEDISCRKNL